MAEQPTNEEILSAVAESGYLLEQDTATVLETAGYSVETNAAYLDPDENRSREIDVLATRELRPAGRLRLILELVVECKRNSYPLVFFSRRKNDLEGARTPREFLFPSEQFSQMFKENATTRSHRFYDPFRHLNLDSFHYYYSQPFFSTQVCAITRKQRKWEATHAGIVDAITFPLAKAVEHRRSRALDINRGKGFIWLLVPLVVVTGDLFILDTTAAEPKIAAVASATLVRELRTRTLDATYVFDFVQSADLPSFISGPLMTFTSHIEAVAQTHADLLISGRLPPET